MCGVGDNIRLCGKENNRMKEDRALKGEEKGGEETLGERRLGKGREEGAT